MRCVLLAATLALACRTLAAQNTPEAAASAFGTAVAAGDWAGAARLMHPGALRRMRELYALALTNENLAKAREQLFGFQSAAEAASAPDTVMFAAFLKSLLSHQPEYLAALKTAKLTTLGHIQQAGDTTLVVTRITFESGGSTVSQFDVMPFLRDGSVWRGLLKPEFVNLATMLKRLVSPVGG
jgi:hypothetical protein